MQRNLKSIIGSTSRNYPVSKVILPESNRNIISLSNNINKRFISNGMDFKISTPVTATLKHLDEIKTFDSSIREGKIDIAKDALKRVSDILVNFPDTSVKIETSIRELKIAQAQGNIKLEIDIIENLASILHSSYPLTLESLQNSYIVLSIVPSSDTTEVVSGLSNHDLVNIWYSVASAHILAYIRNGEMEIAYELIDKYSNMFDSLDQHVCSMNLCILEGFIPELQLRNLDIIAPSKSAHDGVEGEETAPKKKPFKLSLTRVDAKDSEKSTKNNANIDVSKEIDNSEKTELQKKQMEKEDQQLNENTSKTTKTKDTITVNAFNTDFQCILTEKVMNQVVSDLNSYSEGSGDLFVSSLQKYEAILRDIHTTVKESNFEKGYFGDVSDAVYLQITMIDTITHIHRLLSSVHNYMPQLKPYIMALSNETFSYFKTRNAVWADKLSYKGEVNDEIAIGHYTAFGQRIIGDGLLLSINSIQSLGILLTLTEKLANIETEFDLFNENKPKTNNPPNSYKLGMVLDKLGVAYTHLNPVNAEGLLRSAQNELGKATNTASALGRQSLYNCKIDHAMLVSQLTWNSQPRTAEAVKMVSLLRKNTSEQDLIKLEENCNFKYTLEHKFNNDPVNWSDVEGVYEDYQVVFRNRGTGVDNWIMNKYGL